MSPRKVRQGIVAAVQAAALCAFAAVPGVEAEQDPNRARGFSPGEVYDFGGIDSINLFNGSLSVNIPVGPRYPVGDGLSYGLHLSYSSSTWEAEETEIQGARVIRMHPRWSANAGHGWMLSLAGTLYDRPGPSPEGHTGLEWESPDGAEHSFYGTLHQAEGETDPCHYTRDDTYLRLCAAPANGTLERYTIEFPDGRVQTFEEIPLAQRLSDWDDERFQVVRLEDRLGNWVTVDYARVGSKLTWTIEDSVGRSHLVELSQVLVDGSDRWRADRATLQKFGGGTAAYALGYENGTIDRSCWSHPNLPGPTEFIVPLLRELVLPTDGVPPEQAERYRFPAYNSECTLPQTSGDPVRGDLPGTLARLDLPTGGRLEWTYRDWAFFVPDANDPARRLLRRSTGVGTKELLNASGLCEPGSCEWLYEPLTYSDHTRYTRVTSPEGDWTVHWFSQRRRVQGEGLYVGWDYGLPYSSESAHLDKGLSLSQQIYEGQGTNAVLRREIYVGYERDVLIPILLAEESWRNSNRRMLAERTLYYDDLVAGVPRFTETVHQDFDGHGHYRQRHRSGNLVDPNQVPVHTEITAYNPDRGTYAVDPKTNAGIPNVHDFSPWPASQRWSLGTYKSIRVDEPGSPAFEARYCFDASDGRLLRERRLVSASALNHRDVVVAHTRNFVSASDIRYQELIYGGDGQAIGTGDPCTMALPSTPVYRIRHTHRYGVRAKTERLGPGGALLGLEPLNLAIDPSTGLPSSSTDLGGLVTTFDYDSRGRLTWIKPQSGGDAWTEVDYDPAAGATPAQVTVRRRPNGNPAGTALEEARTVYDSLGRVRRDERRIPGHGWTAVETGYDAQGWKTYVTERGPGTPAERTIFRDYDPFGRPREIRLPDYAADNRHRVDLDYNGVRRVGREVSIASNLTGGETRSVTSELYDNMGRLRRVQEPSGAGGATHNTDYQYDAAGRLTAVRMKDPGPPEFDQARFFVYDGRGFLLSETHPENGTTAYSDYDALGHARRKRTGTAEGPFDLAFAYDAAERLIEVKEHKNNGTGRVLKTFAYGDGTTAGDRSNGKVETAVRHNYVSHPDNGNPLEVLVTETYTYGGTAGRVSRRNTALNTGQGFTQAWSWTQLGDVADLTYPTCTHAGAACTSNPRPRTLAHTYQLGHLTAVPGWADSISYHSNGMLNEIDHANGVTYAQGLDPHRMRRPASLSVSHPLHDLALAEGQNGSLLASLPYAYDGAGNVKSWYDWRYRYDTVSRILEGEIVGGWGQKYTYDLYGNLLTIATDRGAGDQTVALGVDRTTNRLSASAYDAAGNLTVRAPYSYTWDSFSMMKTKAGGANDDTYVYTADDERIWSVDASVSPWKETFTLRDLDGKALRTFTTASGFNGLAWSQDYLHRNGQLLATARANGAGETRHHFHLDHLGTPLLITNGQGATEALHSYFPFGEELVPDGDAERMKFTGHERDLGKPGQADDLDYMHARYCSPLLGRFLSVDPASGGARLTNPQSWNRFSYAANNPLLFVDPDGRYYRKPENPTLADEIALDLAADPTMAVGGGFSAAPRVGGTVFGRLALRLSREGGVLGSVGQFFARRTLRVIPTGDVDAAAVALADRIGGQPSARIEGFAQREFDAISDAVVGQTFGGKSFSESAANFLSKARRGQIRATLEVAARTGRKALFEFRGAEPVPEIVDFIQRNAKRLDAEFMVETIE